MNIPQRIVLIIGAVLLLIINASTRSYQHGADGVIYWAGSVEPHIAAVWDWRTALVQSLIISAATLAVYFAVGKRRQ